MVGLTADLMDAKMQFEENATVLRRTWLWSTTGIPLVFQYRVDTSSTY